MSEQTVIPFGWRRQRIDLRTDTGTTQVEAFVRDQLAVHRVPSDADESISRPRYRVTHVGSGRALARVADALTMAGAVAAAEAVRQHHPALAAARTDEEMLAAVSAPETPGGIHAGMLRDVMSDALRACPDERRLTLPEEIYRERVELEDAHRRKANAEEDAQSRAASLRELIGLADEIGKRRHDG